MEEYAETYPFTYSAEDMPDLLRSIERHAPDPRRDVDRWARRFLRREGATNTRELLAAMTHAIRQDFAYVAREEKGTLDPAQTLRAGSGSCRDFALLMMEAVRSLGMAARFVSGYLYSPKRNGSSAGGGPVASAAALPMPGCRSICRERDGWSSIRPTASSATAT